MSNPNDQRARSGATYRYSPNKRDLRFGLQFSLTDDIPAPIRDAEANLQAARANETRAHEAVGAALRAIDTAKTADAQARGQALADGEPAPKPNPLTKERANLSAAEADVQAATIAIDICRQRLEAALTTAKDDGTLAEAVRTISRHADDDITTARDLLAQAEAARNSAAANRTLSRTLDAYPNGPHDGTGAPSSAPDEWRIGLNGINNDLDILTESVALSILKTRPDLRQTPRHVTKSEGKF